MYTPTQSSLVLSLNDRLAHSAPRGDSSRTMGPRKPVEDEPSISVEADCPKSGLGIPAGPLMTGVGAPLSTPLRPVMDRLTGIERPCEPSPTSYGTRAKAGATCTAPGGLWEPHNAYQSRNLMRIQVNHEPSKGGHGCSAPD
ncbi:hypothetical protein THAOC_24667 [Thalassiosira oceanica]|uniref:Uncharacterized protein n=1 Tax=Thalassiosira oceanica TaxID=159749 RepID=K0RRB9_THAOC|nr:hypothetical protein THAOC_24667 [Thalassiosira oceanica]|eukprot:EJK55590.1 hypothetical protein THAOC_24667 [Thalassiosira oceanica]